MTDTNITAASNKVIHECIVAELNGQNRKVVINALLAGLSFNG